MEWVRVARWCKESWSDFLARPKLERSMLGLELIAFLTPDEEETEEDT